MMCIWLEGERLLLRGSSAHNRAITDVGNLHHAVPEDQSPPESRMEPYHYYPPPSQTVYLLHRILFKMYMLPQRIRSSILWKYCYWGLVCFSNSFRIGWKGGSLIGIKTSILFTFFCDLYLQRIEASIPLTHRVEHLEGSLMGAVRLLL